MKKAFDFFVFGNFWVAICAVAQGLLTYQFIQCQPSVYVLFILFLSTFFIYNIRIVLNYTVILKNQLLYTSSRMRCVALNVKTIRILTIISIGLILPLLLKLSTKALFILGIMALLALAYSLPLLKDKRNLRHIPGAKTFIISLIWAISTVLIPIIDSGINLSLLTSILLFTKRFLLVFCLAVIFDIRDIEADKKHQLITFANILGPDRSKLLCYLLLAVHALLITIYDLPTSPDIFYALLIFVGVVAIIIHKSYPVKSDYFYLFWVDGMFVLQYLLILIFQLF